MTGFLRRLTNTDTVDGLLQIGLDQMQLIHEQREEMMAMQLAHARHIRDLIIQFRSQIELPADEVIPYLDAAIIDMNDSVARMEEHVR